MAPRPCRLTSRQEAALRALVAAPLTTSQVARRLAAQPRTTCLSLDALLRRGLVTVEQRVVMCWVITPKGRKRAAA